MKGNWQLLKEAIQVSSPEFYAVIEDLQLEELDKQPEKIQFTLWKYFNRARFRATPYGLFASVGMAKLDNAHHEGITLSETKAVKSLIDWAYKDNEAMSYTFEDLLRENKKVFSNSSYYRSAGDLRYLSCSEGKFELSDVGYSEFIETVLKYCTIPVPIHEVITYLESQPKSMLSGSIPEILEEMIVLQLLFTENDTNVIGTDFFERRGVENEDNKVNIPQYLIPKSKIEHGSVLIESFKHLPELALKLATLNGIKESDDLIHFKKQFQHKFEGNEEPLMVALDPELGIGYGNLEQTANSEDLIEKFLLPFNAPEKEPIAKRFLLDHADNNCFNGVIEIELDKLFQKLPEKETVRLPNTFPALVKIVDDKIILESMGGATANSLLGRFSVADERIENHCTKIAVLESNANPDVLFFDVAYMAEAKVDNINRRKQLYPLTLSILQFDTSEHPLTLEDIFISLHNGNIVLRSKSRNKRLVPRIASAYNHIRSDLSLFRFLCDLQFQGLNTRLGFVPETYFPKQRYYPRITYKNIIVNPAQWALKEEFLKDKSLTDYLNEIQLSRHFTVGNSDQTLLFDKESPEDLQMLVLELAKKKKMFLKEAFIPNDAVFKDLKGNGYNGELVVTLCHENRVYEPVISRVSQEPSKNPIERIIPPGKDWLYWEIFCHPARANKILQDYIQPFIQQHKAQIVTWFFIRYNEGGAHLRFRIQLKNPLDYQILTYSFTSMLQPAIASGIVSDLRLCTYKREMERYGMDLMEAVEQHFREDSTFVLSLLDTVLDDRELYRYCVGSVFYLKQKKICPQDPWEDIAGQAFESFRLEHKITPPEIKLLNQEYVVYRNSHPTKLSEVQEKQQIQFQHSMYQILAQCPQERRVRLFRDLLHMHINRLFPENPRTHEMVFYYLLDRELKRTKHTQL
ncbi:lantibiotic dehydratase [Rhizosphaericola mali]|uniref:Lantibiotic dehydratase n=1 Tax=Rhizosphaericola mali TaxID=2545455 RepID=A0A5P2G593_9BACT|nr:lantibiotic dehydratase [Rhizosphaericola mali]QES88273.1 hypothetical protein E0W69_006185 [Rhizosphaericola mali]